MKTFIRRVGYVLVIILFLIVLNAIPTFRKSTGDMQTYTIGPLHIHHENSQQTVQFVETIGLDVVGKFKHFFSTDYDLPIHIYIYDDQAKMQRQMYGFVGHILPGLDNYVVNRQDNQLMVVGLAALAEHVSVDDLAGGLTRQISQLILQSFNDDLPLFIEQGAIQYVLANPQVGILSENIPSLNHIQNLRWWNLPSFYNNQGPLYAYSFFDYLAEFDSPKQLRRLIQTGSVEETYQENLASLYSGWAAWLQDEPTYARHHYQPQKQEQIFLYGEVHGLDEMTTAQYQAWQDHYDSGMRYLFIESEYYLAQWLNAWMQADDEEAVWLESLITDYLEEGTYYSPYQLEVLNQIKKRCPTTIFCGTDIGHRTDLGQDYLAYLTEKGLKGGSDYQQTLANLKQGDQYYNLIQKGDYDEADAMREQAMVENFMRAYDAIDSENKRVMGIYGDYHANPLDRRTLAGGSQALMAVQLVDTYGDVIAYYNMERWLKN